MPTCTDCGREVDAEWNVCPDCGSDLTASTRGEASENPDRETRTDADGVKSPTQLSRRAAIGSAAVVVGFFAAGIAGIELLGSADHRAAGGDAWEQRSTDSTDAGRALSGTVALEPGTYLAERFSVTAGARIGTRITDIADGAPFDVFGMPAPEFDNYREPTGVDFTDPLSQARIERPRGMFGNPPEDDYYLVIDNTSVYEAEPTGTLRVDVEMGVGDF